MTWMVRKAIEEGCSDGILLELLVEEVQKRAPARLQSDLDLLVARLEQLPVGLRAMAATNELDVSVLVQDLGWHFAKWHHHGQCAETSRGLRELGAGELADVFDQAYAIARGHWDEVSELIARDPAVFRDWYPGSALETALAPWSDRLFALVHPANPRVALGIHRFWIDYARRHPERLSHEA